MATRKLLQHSERSELAEHLEKWASFLLANLLWSLACIPIITIPAATAGLFAVMSATARGQQIELFQEFFGTMRRLWLKSSLLMLLNLATGALILLNLTILPAMDMNDPFAFLSRSVTVFVALIILMANLYAWSLLVIVEQPLKTSIESAFRLVFAYPVWSFGVLVAAVLPLAITLLLPQGFFFIATVSTSVLVINLGTWRVIRRHLSATT